MPVKSLARAKSRLDVSASSSLAFAFLQDALSAVHGCPVVTQAIVVTRDPEVSAYARATGCLVVTEEGDNGINAAARLGARSATGPVAVMVSDLPCLTAGALASVLTTAAAHVTSVLADAEGLGSTMFCALDRNDVTPAFGPSSRSRHRAIGAVDLVTAYPACVEEWIPARLDVDTDPALASALEWGVGPATTAVLAARY